MKIKILVILKLFIVFCYSQDKKQYFDLNSLQYNKNSPIKYIDSLSFERQNLYSAFYWDTINDVPFTGRTVITNDFISIDSISIFNGIYYGMRKQYIGLDTINAEWDMINYEFYDQHNNVKIFYQRTNNNNYITILKKIAGIELYFDIKKKKKGFYISIKSNNKKIGKQKNLSLKQLQEYFKDTIFYKHLVGMGILTNKININSQYNPLLKVNTKIKLN